MRWRRQPFHSFHARALRTELSHAASVRHQPVNRPSRTDRHRAGDVVTATNSVGQSTASLTIAVTAAPLLDLGHASSVDVLRFANSRVLSRDANGHRILQDFASGTTLASGDSPCTPSSPPHVCVLEPIDLAGGVLIDGTTTGLEVRDSSDGRSRAS